MKPERRGYANDLGRRYPEGTDIQVQCLPAIRGALDLRAGNASQAVKALAANLPFELGAGCVLSMYPAYLRAQAYFAAHQGEAAAREFQKILDHPGVVLNEITGSLAHLGLGRAYAVAGDSAKARTAYQDFLALWQEADPDVPLLRAAKAEYAKLR